MRPKQNKTKKPNKTVAKIILKNNLELLYKIELLHTQLPNDSTPRVICDKEKIGHMEKSCKETCLRMFHEGQFITTKTGNNSNSYHLDYG